MTDLYQDSVAVVGHFQYSGQLNMYLFSTTTLNDPSIIAP